MIEPLPQVFSIWAIAEIQGLPAVVTYRFFEPSEPREQSESSEQLPDGKLRSGYQLPVVRIQNLPRAALTPNP